ncbi:atlastin-like [Spodoptera litura]|uniref:Atlastin-like n=1 Tax=Spodoptera litura TaxID=69820 RepID=A0A9J7E5G5_SPOLT|nr:atlastin-like [Spodoptera litura]
MVDYSNSGNMGDLERGEGVQVVKLGEGAQRYELDEEALRRVLMRQDVRGLPVVVVSVAGAYRGGKSFILDFFLRYLNAPRESQVNGNWLGTEDEPLQGFHWRGGDDRDTTGINLWSKPIISTLPTGEKVAVLLMDTQGTFDSETTIGQNSTIFALSTLISSVQIYNLSGNIKEDDLQHLQLFTEYGRLACDTESKAFQTLLFLVRDWPHAFEHPYGFYGGSTLLNKRLQTNLNQKPELREVREHIRSCFDKMICCLMPHPGLTVNNQFFAGCLRELTPDFRRTLLELVPSLFEPTQLVPKLVTGQLIQCQDLLDYFKKYLNIFNSGEIPEAVTILKATADACLLAATREARDLYTKYMQERVRDSFSVSNATLTEWHEEARDQALRRFTEKRKLAAQADVNAHLEALKMELDACQAQHTRDNEFKVQDTMSLAKIAYEAAVSRVCAEHARLCLHPQDLEELHADALRQALEIFDASRDVPQGEEDIKKTNLLRTLEQLHESLSVVSNRNNLNAVWEARDTYVRRMKMDMDQTGVTSERLSAQHEDAVQLAKTAFYSLRSRPTEHANDAFIARLLQEINDCFGDMEKANNYSNMMAMQAAENAYNNYITRAWGPQTCCFHPRGLEDLHNEAVTEVMADILAKRPQRDTTEFKTAVNEIFTKRYEELKKVNVYNNEQAVHYALLVYESKRKYVTNVSVFGIFMSPFDKWLTKHEDAKRAAISEFMNRRRGTDYNNDQFYDDLIKKIENAKI